MTCIKGFKDIYMFKILWLLIMTTQSVFSSSSVHENAGL